MTLSVFHRTTRRAGLAALLAVLLAAAGCSDARSDAPAPAVADVAGQPITVQEFRDRYAGYVTRSGLTDSPRLREQYLQHLVDIKLIVRAQRDAGLAEEEGYRYEAERVERKLLLDGYAEQEIFAPVEATDAELRAYFVRINTKLRARHLYARTEAQARALYARLQAGESFEALAREVFADSALAASGGEVGLFGFDEMDAAFEDAAYALEVGETSAPVKTAQGYSIIRLDERLAQPVMTESDFLEKRGQLRAYVLERKRRAALQAHSAALAEALAVETRPDALARLMAQIDGSALLPEGEALDAWLDAPLLTFERDGRRVTWTVADFRERAQYTADEQRAAVGSPEHLEAFVTGLVVREEMLRRARALGVDRDPRFVYGRERALEAYAHGVAVERFTAATTVPEDSVRAAYEAGRDRYVMPAQVHVREMLFETKAEAERVKALLGTASFETLARAHSVRPGADATGGDLGFVSRAQLGLLADPVFAADAGATLGPLEVAGRYVLLQVGERREARPAAFDEVRADIEQRLRTDYGRQAFRPYVAALRDRYAVAVDLDAALAVVLAD